MWGLEHAAFAYLLILPIYLAARRTIEPELIILIFAFSNLADAMHVGQFRFLLHNTPGLLLAFIIAIIVFKALNVIQFGHVPILGLAVITHVIADLLFSNFYIQYPFDSTGISIFGWMSPEHMLAGSIIISIFIVVFVCSGDYARLRNYVYGKEEKLFVQVQWSRQQSQRKENMWSYYVFALLRIFLGIQIILLAMEITLMGRYDEMLAWILLAVSGLGYMMLILLSYKKNVA